MRDYKLLKLTSRKLPNEAFMRAYRKFNPIEKMTLIWIGIALAGASSMLSATQQPTSVTPAETLVHHATINRYCVTCHNEKLHTAGLMLDKLDVEKVGENAEVWEKVLRKLRSEQMPPAGAPRPDQATYDSLSAYLERALDGAAAGRPDPGRPTVQRLNRSQYTHTILAL